MSDMNQSPTNLLRMCVLGSGSGGNSTVIQSGHHALLLDAGFGPRTTAQRLAQLGMKLSDLKAIVLTHLDTDHFRPTWINACVEHQIPVYLHQWHQPMMNMLPDAGDLHDAGLMRLIDLKAFAPCGGDVMQITPVALPHDDKGTLGYRLDSAVGSIGYATDLGRVPPSLIDLFTAQGGVDLLAIESNYDPVMQRSSSRPWFLKQRIMGGQGHLSNQQAFELARTIVQRSRTGKPARIVLLHRSQQCNGIEIVRRTFAQDRVLSSRVVLTEQRKRTPWLTVTPEPTMVANQLALTFEDAAG